MSLPVDRTIGLIEFLFHAPLGFCLPVLDYYGPYDGNVQIERFSETPGPVFTPRDVGFTQGVEVMLNGAIPPGWGHTLGWASTGGELQMDEYIPPLGMLHVYHQFSNGVHVVTQSVAISTIPTVIQWAIAKPKGVGLLTSPGISLDLFFLMIDPLHVWP